MKNPIISLLFAAITLSFGFIALSEDRHYAVAFAVCCIGFLAYLEISNKKS